MAQYYLTDLPFTDGEGLKVKKSFERHNRIRGQELVITSIRKIRNDRLMKNFKDVKIMYKYKYGHVRVEYLFHGTENHNVHEILQNNFDINRAGTNMGCRYGAGVSFSAHANYASHYADEGDSGTLILSKVLVSNIVEVEENQSQDPSTWLRKPPYIPGRGSLRFDTTAKNKETMDVIVKFDENSFCPSHLVKFKRYAESSLPTQTVYNGYPIGGEQQANTTDRTADTAFAEAIALLVVAVGVVLLCKLFRP